MNHEEDTIDLQVPQLVKQASSEIEMKDISPATPESDASSVQEVKEEVEKPSYRLMVITL